MSACCLITVTKWALKRNSASHLVDIVKFVPYSMSFDADRFCGVLHISQYTNWIVAPWTHTKVIQLKQSHNLSVTLSILLPFFLFQRDIWVHNYSTYLLTCIILATNHDCRPVIGLFYKLGHNLRCCPHRGHKLCFRSRQYQWAGNN